MCVCVCLSFTCVHLSSTEWSWHNTSGLLYRLSIPGKRCAELHAPPIPSSGSRLHQCPHSKPSLRATRPCPRFFAQCPPVPDMNPAVPDWIRMDRGRAGGWTVCQDGPRIRMDRGRAGGWTEDQNGLRTRMDMSVWCEGPGPQQSMTGWCVGRGGVRPTAIDVCVDCPI